MNKNKIGFIVLAICSNFIFLTSCVPSGSLIDNRLSQEIINPIAKPTPAEGPIEDPGRDPGSDPDQTIDRYEGIVSVGTWCSGSMVILRGQPTSSKAMVLSNGHCLKEVPDMFRSYKVKVNATIAEQTFKLFKTKTETFALKVNKIIYGTMTDTDIAFYESTETYDEIESRTGVEPLIMDDQRPIVGTQLEIITGLFSLEYYCAIDKFIPQLAEDVWLWKDSIKYTNDRCKTKPGTSGSPIINLKTREVIGVNNTGNTTGAKCTENNPCERDAAGNVLSYKKGDNYGQQTYWIYSCVDQNFKLDLNRSGCLLSKG